ncbi:TPA: hypothetical protein HA265_08360 [Candidatus Woesearchaeota archaeon]|nr:hypothetical protein [Candidatus Woesearchaeota archaeon]
MDRKAISIFVASILALALFALSVSAQDSCRADYTFKGNFVNLEDDLTGLVDLLTERGYYSLTVYGFSSRDDNQPENTALLRAQDVANRLFDLSGGKITAVPQLGIAGGKTDIFGAPELNQRVIITSTQLFQDEYTPAAPPGVVDSLRCPTVLYCEQVKLHKEQWYCLKKENEQDVWYGPCAHERCIGDVDFSVVSGRMQTELKNVLGEDDASIMMAADQLALEAKILFDNGNHIRALDLSQRAMELYLKVDVDKAMEMKALRNRAYDLALKNAATEEDSKRILAVVRRSGRLIPYDQIMIDYDQHDSLRSHYEKDWSVWSYIFIIKIGIIALIVVVHLLLLAYHHHKKARHMRLDESADEIINDVEGLEMVFRKKMMLADDNNSKLKSLMRRF